MFGYSRTVISKTGSDERYAISSQKLGLSQKWWPLYNQHYGGRGRRFAVNVRPAWAEDQASLEAT